MELEKESSLVKTQKAMTSKQLAELRCVDSGVAPGGHCKHFCAFDPLLHGRKASVLLVWAGNRGLVSQPTKQAMRQRVTALRFPC